MKLSDTAKQLLMCMQLQADLSYRDVAKILGCREHTARRAAAEIEKSGCFIRKASLNLSRLGFTEYNIYLSFNSGNLANRDAIINSVAQTPGVKWVLEVTAGYDLLVGFVARAPSDVTSFFDTLCERNGNFFLAKTVLTVVSYHYYGRRYLTSSKLKSGCLQSNDTGSAAVIDEIDSRILRGLTHASYEGIAQLERQLKVPASTLRLRIKKLSSAGVIVGMTYNLSKVPQGLYVYRAHIFTKGGSKDSLQKMREFARKDSGVVYVVKTLGPWDYELQYESLGAGSVTQLGRKLVEALGDSFLKVDLLPVHEVRKGAVFPF